MIRNCKECDREFTTIPAILKRGSGHFCSRECWMVNKRDSLLGKRFGRLEVISFNSAGKTTAGKNRYYYNVKCDCGKENVVSGKSLRTGDSNSCGCLRIERVILPFGIAYTNTLYKTYELGAKKRNISFDLSIEDFKTISLKNCFYCNSVPRLRLANVMKNYNGKIPLNGIDRINNSLGYSLENSVPCCTDCNRMKMAMGVNDFINHIEKIYLHQKNKHLEFPPSYLTVIS